MTAANALRVGLVGLGWFGRTHMDAWASVRGATVAGVCDRDPNAMDSNAVRAQENFHSDAGAHGTPVIPADLPRYDTVDALLSSGIDLLDIVVTEDEHETCVRAALEAGVHVVVEKPLALSLDATTGLIRLAEQVGKQIYVGQVLRFDPRHVALAEMIHGGEMRHLSLSRHFQSSAHSVYGRVHPILNAAVHDIDLAIWLTGKRPVRVTAFASHFLGDPHPDTLDLVMEWDSGLRAVVQNSWHLAASCPYGFTFDCTVHTTEDTYTVRSEPVLQRWSTTSVTSPELFFWPRYAGVRGGALVAELQHFADQAAIHQPSDRVPLTDVLAVMSTCEAAMTSLRTGRPHEVRLPTDSIKDERRHG